MYGHKQSQKQVTLLKARKRKRRQKEALSHQEVRGLHPVEDLTSTQSIEDLPEESVLGTLDCVKDYVIGTGAVPWQECLSLLDW